jgi:glycosyltransferase involved in cell wall biosynthesis
MKIVLFANTEWYLYNFRHSLAMAVRDAGHDIILISPSGPYGQKLQEDGFRWIAAPMNRRSLNPFRETALVWWLFQLFRRERPDLVHAFTIKSAVYGALAARLAWVDARVSAVAGMGYVFINDDARARLLRPLVRFMLRVTLGGRRARVILQNPDDVAFFRRERLVDAAAIRLIPGSGVDCTRFSPPSGRSSNGSSMGASTQLGGYRMEGDRHGRGAPLPAPFRVLLPARLLWDKGVADYVGAARRLLAEGRRICFLLAGAPDPGNPAAVPVSTLREWDREGVVKWLGHVDDILALFDTVDVVVLPSYREGLPKGLIEAGACGLPLITTDAPGCREVVTHEVDGLLVPVRDAASLAAAIARLQDDPVLRAKLGQAARAKVLAEFDERIVIERTMAVYQELLPGFARNARARRARRQC